MRLSTINCFLISGTVALLAGCSSTAVVVRRPPAATVWSNYLRSDETANRYRITLTAPQNRITGICVIKKNGDEWRGTLVNEFGAKAFDFIITQDKCRLQNVIPMINKWYIRKIIAADLYFLFNADCLAAPVEKKCKRFEQDGCTVIDYGKKRLAADVSQSAVRLENRRHRLIYELKKMD